MVVVVGEVVNERVQSQGKKKKKRGKQDKPWQALPGTAQTPWEVVCCKDWRSPAGSHGRQGAFRSSHQQGTQEWLWRAREACESRSSGTRASKSLETTQTRGACGLVKKVTEKERRKEEEKWKKILTLWLVRVSRIREVRHMVDRQPLSLSSFDLVRDLDKGLQKKRKKKKQERKN